MIILWDSDEKILMDFLLSYKECFEAMNNALCEIVPRVELTDKEFELLSISEAKYKNMVYHVRKWDALFLKK